MSVILSPLFDHAAGQRAIGLPRDAQRFRERALNANPATEQSAFTISYPTMETRHLGGTEESTELKAYVVRSPKRAIDVTQDFRSQDTRSVLQWVLWEVQ